MSYYLSSDLAEMRRPKSLPVRYFVGLDLGQAQDFTALVILEHIPTYDGAPPSSRGQVFHCRHLARYPLGTSYPDIVDDVSSLVARPPLAGASRIAIDATGVGRAVTDLFRDARRSPSPKLAAPLHAITITGGDQVHRDRQDYRIPKRDLVGVVQALLQSGTLKIAPQLPLAPTLVAELENFKATISANGHDSYGAGAGDLDWRGGAHDDLVLAVAMAAWDAKHGSAAWARSY